MAELCNSSDLQVTLDHNLLKLIIDSIPSHEEMLSSYITQLTQLLITRTPIDSTTSQSTQSDTLLNHRAHTTSTRDSRHHSDNYTGSLQRVHTSSIQSTFSVLCSYEKPRFSKIILVLYPIYCMFLLYKAVSLEPYKSYGLLLLCPVTFQWSNFSSCFQLPCQVMTQLDDY